MIPPETELIVALPVAEIMSTLNTQGDLIDKLQDDILELKDAISNLQGGR